MDLHRPGNQRHQSWERVKFFPRKFSDLKNTLQTWLDELVETGKSEVCKEGSSSTLGTT